MKQMPLLLIIIIALGLTSCSEKPDFPSGTWVDLTYEFSSETIYWPTSALFAMDTVFAGRTEAGYYYSSYQFCTAEHGGTHIDAPVHFAEGRQSVEQIPLSRLIGPAIKIDVSASALANRDYQVSVADLQDWENVHGPIPAGSIVLLQSGFGTFWPDPAKYLGTSDRGAAAVADLHFPGLHPEAAKWLVENRAVLAIGLDTASIDYGQSALFESHVILMQENIPAFENVANLEQVPATGAFVIALPIKIKGGSGGPLRIVALVP